MKRSITKFLALMCLAVVVALAGKADVKAEYIEGKGASYSNEAYVSVQYAHTYYGGAGNYSYISMKDNARITNVKSSSKNLLTKVTKENYSIRTSSKYDPETYERIYERKTNVGSYYIAYFAKKNGKYKVTFDVVDEKGNKIDQGTITVKTSYPATKSPVKNVTYAGKAIWEYGPYTTKKSGNFKVTMNKGYKLVKIVMSTPSNDGTRKEVTIKNNKKVKLATSDYYKNASDYSINERDALFPGTSFTVYYKNTKTKEEGTWEYTLRTLNTKALIK